MSWDIKEVKDRLPAGVTPYVDWEKTLRPPSQRAPKGADGNWAPVYIYVAGENQTKVRRNARRILEKTEKNLSDEIRANSDGLFRLNQLKAFTPDQEDLRYLFIYRPEAEASTPLSYCRKTLYEVRRVGPAIPFAFVDPKEFGDGLRLDFGVAATPVVTGIIDDAIGVAHERFRRDPDTTHTTRIAKFWRQMTEGMNISEDKGVLLGIELDGPDIKKRLGDVSGDEAAFYRRLDADTFATGEAKAKLIASLRLSMQRRRSHGTCVADLAAGADPGSGDDSPIFAVELPALATAESWGSRIEVYALMALMRMIYWADREGDDPLPLVVNISYTLSSGDRDGTSFLESEIARHVAARNARKIPTAVVFPSGNAFRAQRHGEMVLKPAEGASRLDWFIPPADQAPSYIEIRLPKDAAAKLCIKPPAITGLAPICLTFAKGTRPNDIVIEHCDERVMRAYTQPTESRAGWVVTLALAPTRNWERSKQSAPPGIWELSAENTGHDGDFHVTFDVQRDDSPAGFPLLSRASWLEDRDAYNFDEETCSYQKPGTASSVKRRGTLSVLVSRKNAGLFAIGGAVGSEMRAPVASPRLVARYSASGPMPSGRVGPDLSAVSEDGHGLSGVLGAGTFSGSTMPTGGTSVAAPQFTRKLVSALGQVLDNDDPVHAAFKRVRDQDAKHNLYAPERLGDAVLPPQGRSTKRRRAL